MSDQRKKPGLPKNLIVPGVGVVWEAKEQSTPEQDKGLEPALVALVQALADCKFPLPLRLTFLPTAISAPADDVLPPTRN